MRLFADDTALYLTIESEDDGSALQNDLDILSKWETRWDMEFNPSKCQVVHMTSSKKVQAGKDQEKAQSEKDSHSKNRGGKKPN